MIHVDLRTLGWAVVAALVFVIVAGHGWHVFAGLWGGMLAMLVAVIRGARRCKHTHQEEQS